MKRDQFTNRYIIKIASSVIIAVINVVIQMLIPRALTKVEYGYYTYDMNTFVSLVVLANLSASNAMVAKFSKRNEEIGILRFYLKFYAVMAIVLNIGLAITSKIPAVFDSFGGQTLLVVLLALDANIVNKLLTDTVSMYDASAISRFPAVLQMLLKILLSVAVVITYALRILNLEVFFGCMLVFTGGIVLWLLVELFRDNKERYPQQLDAGTKAYLKEYAVFCKPLVFATIFSQVVVIVMNTALMNFGGAAEQADFGVAWQLNTMVGYVFVPYAELMKREFAMLTTDPQKMRDRFHQSYKLMFWITSYFAVFIGIFSKYLLSIVFGDNFANAIVVTILIMYYTIYQSVGQLMGAYMIATEKTRLQAITTVIGQVLTLACVFLFQIPNFIWPKGLGSSGIAWNYLVVNIITNVILVTIIAGHLGISRIRENLIQLPAIAICSGTALVCYWLVAQIPGSGILMMLVRVLVGGLAYTAVIGGVIYGRPDVIGMSRESLQNKVGAILAKIKRNNANS